MIALEKHLDQVNGQHGESRGHCSAVLLLLPQGRRRNSAPENEGQYIHKKSPSMKYSRTNS
jgi:hypothetical protein